MCKKNEIKDVVQSMRSFLAEYGDVGYGEGDVEECEAVLWEFTR